MFKHKNALISIAVAMMLAACGGSSDDNDTPNPKPGTEAPTPTPNPDPGTEQPGTVEVTTDEKLSQTAILERFILFGQGENTWGQLYTAFSDDTPRTEGEYANSYGIYGVPSGELAPIQGFGFRLTHFGAGEEESKPGRLAFELKDQEGSSNNEKLQIEIDKIETRIDASGKITITVAEGAMVYVHVTDSANRKVTRNAIASPALIKQIAVSGDPGTTDILLDVEGAIAAVNVGATGTDQAVLASIQDFTDEYGKPMKISLTLSNLDIALSTATTDKLKGQSIIVEGAQLPNGTRLPGVSGGGVEGYVQFAAPPAG